MLHLVVLLNNQSCKITTWVMINRLKEVARRNPLFSRLVRSLKTAVQNSSLLPLYKAKVHKKDLSTNHPSLFKKSCLLDQVHQMVLVTMSTPIPLDLLQIWWWLKTTHTRGLSLELLLYYQIQSSVGLHLLEKCHQNSSRKSS